MVNRIEPLYPLREVVPAADRGEPATWFRFTSVYGTSAKPVGNWVS